MRHNADNIFILSPVFLKVLVVGVASFWATLYLFLVKCCAHLIHLFILGVSND